MGLLKPKWKHKNPDIRKAAVINIMDENLLAKITKDDTADYRVRLIALEKLDPTKWQEFFLDIALGDWDPSLREAATKKITVQSNLAKLAKSDNVHSRTAVELLNDTSLLTEVAIYTSDYETGSKAVEKIKNMEFLAEIAKEARNSMVSAKALTYIDEEDLLKEIALTGKDTIVRCGAVKKITRQNDLIDIALKSDNYCVCSDALKQIDDKVIKQEISIYVDKSAIKNMNDQDKLLDVLKKSKFIEVQKAALEKIEDKDLLFAIVKNSNDKMLRKTAIQNIEDREMLMEIALNDKDFGIRLEAGTKIDDGKLLYRIVKKDDQFDIVSRAAFEKLAIHGQYGEPYCSSDCERRVAGNRAYGNVVRCNCFACKSVVTIAAPHLQTFEERGVGIPWRGGWVAVCDAHRGDLENFIWRIKEEMECCLCSKKVEEFSRVVSS